MQIRKTSAFWFSILCKYGKPSDIQPGRRISWTVKRPNIKGSVLSQDTGRSRGLAIGSTGRRITMENQAKKRKGGADKLRDKKTPPSLDKVLPIEKRLCLFYTKLKKYVALK